MAVTLIVEDGTGLTNANSYLTVAEFTAYLETAYPVTESTDALDDGPTLVAATRMLDMMLSGGSLLVRNNGDAYRRTLPSWSGSPTTTTQALAWPRTGMLNRNGGAIASNVIPQDLKNAVAELGRQMKKGDRMLDNDISVQGIRSLSAGPVSLSFKDSVDTTKMIPDSVMHLLVPSWIVDEEIEPAQQYLLDVID